MRWHFVVFFCVISFIVIQSFSENLPIMFLLCQFKLFQGYFSSEVNQRSLVTLSLNILAKSTHPTPPHHHATPPPLLLCLFFHNGSALVGSGCLQITAVFVQTIPRRYILYHSGCGWLFSHLFRFLTCIYITCPLNYMFDQSQILRLFHSVRAIIKWC